MIKHLRWKLVAITMVLMTVVLLVILGFIYHFTRTGLVERSMSALQAAGMELGPPDRPGRPKSLTTSPCFLLEMSPDGKLKAVGTDYYDLDDRDALLELLKDAEEMEVQSGLLEDQQLRFLRLDAGPGFCYAFMDISDELDTLSRLNLTCAIILAAGVIGFFCISVLLARWAVRPVEQAWEQQRQFVADASHELKTPLTVILTNAELLRSEEYDDQSKIRFVDSILIMSGQMRGLVEELLDQARVDNGFSKVEQSRLDYSKLVSDAVLPFEPVYYEAGRELRSVVQPGITVNGSADHLRRVVEILLDNGCKYSSPGGVVELRLERQGRGNCLLSVSSPGEPMTEQQCLDVFKRFYRANPARSMNRSYGLGLSIAQGIIQQHRGKIWAQSRNGINTFYVNLPM
jgi:signal transduction histidine kinase